MQSCELWIILKHGQSTKELHIQTVFNEYVYTSLFMIFLKGKYYIKARLVWPITEIISSVYFNAFR